jgi:hypothetical protein
MWTVIEASLMLRRLLDLMAALIIKGESEDKILVVRFPDFFFGSLLKFFFCLNHPIHSLNENFSLSFPSLFLFSASSRSHRS